MPRTGGVGVLDSRTTKFADFLLPSVPGAKAGTPFAVGVPSGSAVGAIGGCEFDAVRTGVGEVFAAGAQPALDKRTAKASKKNMPPYLDIQVPQDQFVIPSPTGGDGIV